MSDAAALSDGQLTALVAVIGAGLTTIAGAIKWGIGRLAKSWDENSKGTRDAIERNTEAMIDNTSSNAVLSTKVDNVHMFVQVAERERTGNTPVHGTPITIAPVNTSSTPVKAAQPSAPITKPDGGYSYARPKTRGDGK